MTKGADSFGPTDQFDGEIIASGGIKLLSAETVTAPDSRRIRWVRESNGFLATSIESLVQTNGASQFAHSRLYSNLDESFNEAVVSAFTRSAGKASGFYANAFDGSNSPARWDARAIAGAQDKKIIDADGLSDFAFTEQYAELTDSATDTSSGASTWIDPTSGTAGPSLVVAQGTGVYIVEWGAGAIDGNAASTYAAMGIRVNASDPGVDFRRWLGLYHADAFEHVIYGAAGRCRLSLTNGDTLKCRYTRWSGAGSISYAAPRWISARRIA